MWLAVGSRQEPESLKDQDASSRLIAWWALFAEYLESLAERSAVLEQAACELNRRDFLVEVAIATVRDAVPLRGDSRLRGGLLAGVQPFPVSALVH